MAVSNAVSNRNLPHARNINVSHDGSVPWPDPEQPLNISG
jgi:hypothetical protein